MMLNRLTYIFRPLLLCTAYVFASAASAVTITEVLAEIEKNNPTLKSTAATNLADELELRSENTLPPTSIEYSPFFRSGVGGVASSELIISQEFDFPTLYAARSRQAGFERKVLDGAAALQRRDILLEARNTILNMILLQKEKVILNARFTDTKALLGAYEHELELGQTTLLDVNKVKLECLELERELMQNEIDQETLVNSLTLLNANSTMNLSDIDYEIPTDEVVIPADPEKLVLLDPSILEAFAEIAASKHAMKVAKSGWLPGFTVGYRRNTEEKEASNGFLVGASLPIFSNSAKTKAASARLTASRLALETATSKATAEIHSLIKQLQMQKATLSTYDESLIMETLKLYRKSLNARQTTLTTYYTETNALYDQLLTRIRLEHDIQLTYSLLTANQL